MKLFLWTMIVLYGSAALCRLGYLIDDKFPQVKGPPTKSVAVREFIFSFSVTAWAIYLLGQP